MARPKLKIKVKGTTAKRKKKKWILYRKGKKIIMDAVKKTWKVKPKIQYRKDLGAKGRGRRVIPVTGLTDLRKHGYSADKSAMARRIALRKADRAYGSRAVWNKLHAMTIMRAPIVKGTPRVRTASQLANYRKFRADRNWVMKTLMSAPERRAMTRPAVKEWKGMTYAQRVKARARLGEVIPRR